MIIIIIALVLSTLMMLWKLKNIKSLFSSKEKNVLSFYKTMDKSVNSVVSEVSERNDIPESKIRQDTRIMKKIEEEIGKYTVGASFIYVCIIIAYWIMWGAMIATYWSVVYASLYIVWLSINFIMSIRYIIGEKNYTGKFYLINKLIYICNFFAIIYLIVLLLNSIM